MIMARHRLAGLANEGGDIHFFRDLGLREGIVAVRSLYLAGIQEAALAKQVEGKAVHHRHVALPILVQEGKEV